MSTLQASLQAEIRALEEQEYQSTQRVHIVPPHYVLVNPQSQKEHDALLKKDQRLRILQKNYLSVPEGQMLRDTTGNLLSVVNEQVFQKPWDKLDMEYKLNRLFIYLNGLGLDAQQLKERRRDLSNAIIQNCLTSERVRYDCQSSVILEIKDSIVSRVPTIRAVSRIISETPEGITTEPISPEDLDKILNKPPEKAARMKAPVIRKRSE